ncbi:MAG: ATP-binding protein [Chloroflexota bacterium]
MEAKALENLISYGESATVEFKVAVPRELELAQRLCGLANTNTGGYMVIGVEDTTWRIVGVTNPSKDIDELLKSARKCEPGIQFDPPTPEIVIVQDKKLVVATVPPNDGTVYQVSGAFLIRRGTHTLPMTTAELKRYMYRQGVLDWESQPVIRTTLADLDLKLVKIYHESLQNFSRRPSVSSSADSATNLEELLVKVKCAIQLEDGSGRICPTNAGLFLFGKAPREIFTQAEVVLTYYQDNTGLRRYADRKIIGGTIPEMIDSASDILKLWTPVAGEVKGFQRVDEPALPLEALREAIINALVHRDYSIEGTAVRVFYYPDRVEIYNPGRLMPGLSLEQLREGRASSLPRNPVIATILRDLPGGYMERVGSGVRYMISQLRQYGLPDPEFKEIDTEFAVTFYRASTKTTTEPQTYRQVEMAIGTGANPMPVANSTEKTGLLHNQQQRREMALEYVRKNGSISHKEYRTLTGAGESTAIRDLESMVNNGIIRRIGDGPRRRYVI